MVGGMFAAGTGSAPPAEAAGPFGPGLEVYGILGQGFTWLGQVPSYAGMEPGEPSACIQGGLEVPDGEVPTETGLVADPQLAYIWEHHRNETSDNGAAAWSYLTHSRQDLGTGAVSGESRRAAYDSVVAAQLPEVKALADQWLADAATNAGPYTSIAGDVSMTSTKTGTINNIRQTSNTGSLVPGKAFTLRLFDIDEATGQRIGPSTRVKFDETGTNVYDGTTATTPVSVAWTAIANGKVDYELDFHNTGRTTLTMYKGGQKQAVLNYGGRGAGDPSEVTVPGTQFDVLLDFDPVLTSQVASEWVLPGQPVQDVITAAAAPGQTWPMDVNGEYYTLRARGVATHQAVHPFVEAATTPADAEQTGDVIYLDFKGPGSITTTNGVEAFSGRTNYVWSFLKADQATPEIANLIRTEFSDRFGLAAETSKTPFRVAGETQANDRVVSIGSPLIDTIRAFATADTSWMIRDDGQPVASVFTSTSIGPVSMAPVQGTPLDGMPVNGSEQLTFTADGEQQTSGNILGTAPGFYTYDTAALKADLAAADAPYIESDWRDETWRESETVSVRHKPTHFSIAREYTLTPESRLFDTIRLGSYPADHGDYEGTPGTSWTPDVDNGTVTVYEVPKETVNDNEAVPEGTTVLWQGEIPATNGDHELGYDETIGYDGINDDTKLKPGMCYVFVYDHPGSDRVEPLSSHLNDIRERGCVSGPETPEAAPKVITNAVQNAAPGDMIWDTALVTGDVPAGTTLVVKSYLGDVDEQGNPLPATCTADNLINTSTPVPVGREGLYDSAGFEAPDVKGTKPIWHVEVLVNDGEEITKPGDCGAPYEMSLISTPPVPPTPTPEPSTPAPVVPSAETQGEGAVTAGEGLAQTGAAVTSFVVVALVLAVGGTTLLVIRRRRAVADLPGEQSDHTTL